MSTIEAAIEKGEFVEYARVHSNMYGTSVGAVEKVVETFVLESLMLKLFDRQYLSLKYIEYVIIKLE